MNVKIAYNSDGYIQGYYPEGVDYSNIPDLYVTVGESVWLDCVNNPGRRKINPSNGSLIILEESLTNAKANKLSESKGWTAAEIIGGFWSSASGTRCKYDSDDNDQDNLKLMQSICHSEAFATDPEYQGVIPIRAVPEGATDKTVLYLTPAQMDTLIEDLARHIGACKKRGWQRESEIKALTTVAQVKAFERE